MNENRGPNKAIVAVSLALVLVLLLVFGVFIFGKPAASHVEITLPEPQAEQEPVLEDDYLAENSLLRVTPENAAVALESLKRPVYYHQNYSVWVGSEDSAKESTVELWVNGDLMRAQIQSGDETKVILTDGVKVCLWYASDERVVYRSIDEDITFEDILGLPAFDYLRTLREGDVTDAEYLVLEDDQNDVPCIFLSVLETSGAQTRYWIDLSTGTLYEADSVEDGDVVYRVEQTSFDRLVNGDELFADKFLRPDGASAFTG